MKLLESVLESKPHDFVVIKAYAAGRTLFAALEAFAHPTEKVVTVVVAIDLDSLAVELIHEAAISVVDYLYADGWHGLLLRDGVLELGSKPTLTKATLGEGGTLSAIGRQGTTTLVCGTKQLGNYAIEGFVAKVAGGKLVSLVESSKLGDPGPLHAMHVTAKQICAGGGIVRRGTALVIRGDGRTFETVTAGGDDIYSVYQKADGSILVGARGSACLCVPAGNPTALSGIRGRGWGVTEFRGDEYWMSHDESDFMYLFRRKGAKLEPKYKTKFFYVGYRTSDGLPDGRLTASDLLIATNKNRIHLYDGKRWSQLALQPDVTKLVKALPAAMKR